MSMAAACLASNEPAPAAAAFGDEDFQLCTNADFAVKCMLRNIMLQRGITIPALANMLKFKDVQQAEELLNLFKPAPLDDLYLAFVAVGRPLQICC